MVLELAAVALLFLLVVFCGGQKFPFVRVSLSSRASCELYIWSNLMMVSNWDWIDPEHISQEENDGVGAPHFKIQRAYVEVGTSRGWRPRERLGER